MRSLIAAALLLLAGTRTASAQPLPATPPASDTPWPGGAMRLTVDASDVTRRLLRVHQEILLPPGLRAITLLYPEWLPGSHGPRGPIDELAGLGFTADGAPAAWRRDPIDVNAFTVDLPDGARSLVAEFVITSPLRSAEGRVTMTDQMLDLQWEKVSLYPAGYFVSRIPVQPTLVLPAGWNGASALDGRNQSGNRIAWAQTDYGTLVDSPVYAGAYFRQWPLAKSVTLNAFADDPGYLALDAQHLGALSKLVDEGFATFGTPPFDHYDFLVALSDQIGDIGLEHLRSNESQVEPRNFTSWSEYDWDRNVLAHEFAHAWNGKYRRPEGLATPDYRTPMRDELLWIYEGQTQFWGWVLAARSGVQSRDTVLGMIASAAGSLADAPGRHWRPLADTTLDPIIAARKPRAFASYSRGEDYYKEGALVWLEADQVIRKGTGGTKGLDDFARAFFAASPAHPGIYPYRLDDVVAALNATYAYDWAAFFHQRIDAAARPAPLAGIEMAGYHLVWKDRPNPYDDARMQHFHTLELDDSLGLTVNAQGEVSSPQWDSPAFRAGLLTGTTIVAVDRTAFSPDALKQAIARAGSSRKPIELIVKRGNSFDIVSVPYYAGLRWPWLEPASPGTQTPLDRLLAPRARSGA